jgi:hypothetical protein
MKSGQWKRVGGISGLVATLLAGFIYLKNRGLSPDDMKSLAYGWSANNTYVYKLEMSQEGWTAFDQAWQALEGQSAPRMPFRFSWKADDVQLSVLEQSATGTLFALDFPTSQLEISYGEASAVAIDSTRAALGAPAYFRMDPKGIVSDIVFPRESTPISRNLTREFLVQSFPRLQVGQLTEAYKNGLRSLSQLAKHNDGLVMERELLGFQPKGHFLGQTKMELEGRARYGFDQQHLVLRSAEVLSRYKVHRDQGQIQDETTGLHLQLVDTKPLESQQIEAKMVRKEGGIKGSLDGREEFEQAEREALKKKIQGRTFENELREFLQLGSEVEMVKTYHQFDRLLAFLKLSPHYAEDVLSSMADYPASDSRFDILAAALVKTQNLDVQMKLLDFMSARNQDADLWRQVLFNFALQPELSPQILDRVQGFLNESQEDSPRYRALIENLGSIAYQTPDTKRQNEIYDILVSKAAASREVSALAPYVVGLGNLGHSKTIEWARETLAAEDPQRRRLVPQALRRVKDAEAGRLLIDLVVGDRDLVTRQEASQALAGTDYGVESLEEIGRLLSVEKNQQIAIYLVEVLGRSEGHKDRAITLLEDYLRKCGDPQVCQRVESLLVGKRDRSSASP